MEGNLESTGLRVRHYVALPAFGPRCSQLTAFASAPSEPFSVIPRVLLVVSETTRLTEKGQATIPKELREKYGLEPGDELRWIEADEGIVVRKESDSARGALVPEDTSEADREAVAQSLEERLDAVRQRNRPPTGDDA